MKREEINEKYKWDLTQIYPNDEAHEIELQELSNEYKDFLKFKGRLTKSSEILEAALDCYEKIHRKISKLYTYAHLKNDQDTKNSRYSEMHSRVMALYHNVEEVLSYFEPEILESDEAHIISLLGDSKKHYRKFFSDIFRKKSHTLSEEMEGLLAKAGTMAEATYKAFSKLTNADFTFPDVLDSEGNPHKLTNGSYISLMQSKDRTLRQNAFKTLYEGYKNHINVLASLLESEVNKNIFYAKTKKFNSAREAALFQNAIPMSVPDSLIKAVNENLPTLQKALKLRKKALGYEELHLYDFYVPLVQSVDFNIPYDEAKDIVLKSMKPLGNDYQAAVEKGYSDGWIDVYENDGKRSGAYSSGCYDTSPYILLNHKDNLDSMFTLTHELGHSMHSYLTRKTQDYVYGDYSIFVAEVASTTNECLLLDYLREQETDTEKRKYLLDDNIDQFRGTMFRQTMFAEFERDIHAHVENGGALTVDYLCDTYYALNKKYFGDDVVVDEEIRYEWARIPHFYYNFYVYQYATGYAAANSFALSILNEYKHGENKGAIEKYLGFLKSGSSDYPLEVLRKAGVDMETSKPVDEAIKIFENIVDELDKLM